MTLGYLIIRYIHLIAMAFGLGGATVAMILSRMAEKNPELAPIIMKVIQSVSKLIWLGLILLILSGFAFSFVGSSSSSSPQIFNLKMITVAILLINGLLMNFVLNPRFQELVPRGGEKPSPEFLKVKKYLKISGLLSFVFWYVLVALAVVMLYL